MGVLATLFAAAVAAVSYAHTTYLEGTRAASTVSVPDADDDAVADVVEASVLATDPRSAVGSAELPEGWIYTFGLDVSDTALSARPAPLPPPEAIPAVYGGDLPAEFRLTLGTVYAHARPPDWNESEDGAWFSGLDPRRWDHADSGVPYGFLLHFGLDPLDTGALDRVPQGAEVDWTPREAYVRGLHPLLRDGDRDGLDDVTELADGLDPRAYSTAGHGIADGWLVRHGLDARAATVASRDDDMDGLTNVEEFRATLELHGEGAVVAGGLDPRRSSSASSTIPDGWLVHYGFDPLDGGIDDQTTQRLAASDDHDASDLTVADEYSVNRPPSWNETRNGPWWGGTDPVRADSDDDGLDDALEIIGWRIKTPTGTRVVQSNPTRVDTDTDGLTDAEERAGEAGSFAFEPTNPSNPDTDFDGLSDGQEIGRIPWRTFRIPQTNPVAEDTDLDGLSDGEEAAAWVEMLDAARGRAAYPWGPPGTRSWADVLAALGVEVDALKPSGDVDGDGIPNLLDQDADGDSLLDGWEMRPRLYQATTFSSSVPRPVTNPANADTDADGLPDDWEIKYGLYGIGAEGWNLDPSKWSSLGNGVSDADTNLDADQITWYSYHEPRAAPVPQANVFRATNIVEYRAGSDPNRFSSSPDGLSDAWKIFWGQEYLTLTSEARGIIYPGAPNEVATPPDRPLPRIGADDSAWQGPLATYTRADVGEAGKTLPWETVEASNDAFVNTLGERVAYRIISAQVRPSYAAAAGNDTNPYLDDSDGDGMPDWWESLWARLGTTASKVDPNLPDAAADVDDDGLTTADEWRSRSNPYRADSDGGGVGDATEMLVGLDPMNPTDDVRGVRRDADADGDGLADFDELVGWRPRPDSPTAFRTDPQNPDSDGDGLLDGDSLHIVLGRPLQWDLEADAARLVALRARGVLVMNTSTNGVLVVGERTLNSDPTVALSARDGVPSGWRVLHGLPLSDSSSRMSSYAYGRPIWWNETLDGVWWRGLAPGEIATRDRDCDGLDDLTGEDPIPFVNQLNRPRDVDPASLIDPLARRIAAQAYPDPVPCAWPTAARPESRVTLDRLDSNASAADGLRFGGNLTTTKGAPVSNATVILEAVQRAVVLGVAVTNETGGFVGTWTLAREVEAPADSEGIPVFGQEDGAGVHKNRDDALAALPPSGAIEVRARASNVSFFPPARQALLRELPNGTLAPGLAGSTSGTRTILYGLPIVADAQLPPRLAPSEPFTVNVTLATPFGYPIQNATVGSSLAPFPGRTDAAGRYSFAALAPATPGQHIFNVTHGTTTDWFQLNVVAPTHVRVSVPPFDIVPGEPVAIVIQVSDHVARLAGVPVSLDVPRAATTVTTNGQGTATWVWSVPSDLGEGQVEVRACVGANATHAGGCVKTSISIAFEPRWLTATTAVTPIGDQQLTAQLIDATGSGIGNLPAEISIGPSIRRATTLTPDGRLNVTLNLSLLPPGDHVARLSAETGGNVVEGSFLVHAQLDTVLDLLPAKLVRGQPNVVEARLVDARGDRVANAAVTLTLHNATRTAISDRDGIARAAFPAWPTLHPGTIGAAARFDGAGGALRASSAQTSFAWKDAPRIELDNDTMTRRQGMLGGRVVTLAGPPTTGLHTTITAPWGSTSIMTKRDGSFVGSIATPNDVPLGAHEVVLTIREDTHAWPFEARFPIVLRDLGTLEITGPTASLPGAPLRFSWSVRDPAGNAAIGATLVAAHSSGVLYEGGVAPAVIQLPPETQVGPFRIEFTAAADLVMAEPVEWVVNVRAPVELHLQPVVEESVVRFNLSSAGAPLSRETLTIRTPDGRAYEAVTDDAGVAVFPSNLIAQSGLVQADFAGSDAHAPASLAAPLKAPVETSTQGLFPLWWIYAFLAVLAVTVGAHLYRRLRPTAKETALNRARRRLLQSRGDFRAVYEVYQTLVSLARVSEEEEELLTPRRVVGIVAEGTAASEQDVAILDDLINRVLYAGDQASPAEIARATEALGRMSAAPQESPA